MHRIRFHYIVLALAVSLFGCTAAFGGDYAVGKSPDSFRGMAWGTPVSELPELLPVKGRRYKDTYHRLNEPLRFGEAEIQSVAYYFRNDRLYRVGVAFNGRVNHFLIKEKLLSMFGRGRSAGMRYGWMWPDFSVEITFEDETKNGALFYTYEGKLGE